MTSRTAPHLAVEKLQNPVDEAVNSGSPCGLAANRPADITIVSVPLPMRKSGRAERLPTRHPRGVWIDLVADRVVLARVPRSAVTPRMRAQFSDLVPGVKCCRKHQSTMYQQKIRAL